MHVLADCCEPSPIIVIGRRVCHGAHSWSKANVHDVFVTLQLAACRSAKIQKKDQLRNHVNHNAHADRHASLPQQSTMHTCAFGSARIPALTARLTSPTPAACPSLLGATRPRSSYFSQGLLTHKPTRLVSHRQLRLARLCTKAMAGG